MHPLHDMLVAAAAGRFPPPDGVVDVHPSAPGGAHAVVEFTGRVVVLTDRAASELRARGADGFGGASQPDVVQWLAGPRGVVGSHDVVLVASGRGDADGSLVERMDLEDHPRVVRARRHRRDVQVLGNHLGVVTLGRGLVDRLEISVEVVEGTAGHDARLGAGRRLIADALGTIAGGELVWAQVAPGNAASLRAFLAAGFTPIGAETLIAPSD